MRLFWLILLVASFVMFVLSTAYRIRLRRRGDPMAVWFEGYPVQLAAPGVLAVANLLGLDTAFGRLFVALYLALVFVPMAHDLYTRRNRRAL